MQEIFFLARLILDFAMILYITARKGKDMFSKVKGVVFSIKPSDHNSIFRVISTFSKKTKK